MAAGALMELLMMPRRWSIDGALDGQLAIKWSSYIMNLKKIGICLNQEEDILIWSGNKQNGTLSAKLAYDVIVSHHISTPPPWWTNRL